MTDDTTTTEQTDSEGDAPNPEQGAGFEPPEKAQWARFRRFDPETAMWTDSPVIYEGKTTAWVLADRASPALTIADPVPTTYRITWVDENRRPVGYSKAWRILEQAGGASNTPRMWPPGSPDGTKGGAPSSLTPVETVALMRGLANVATELARPMVMQIEAFHEGALTREREFHERQRATDAANFERTVARDREFMSAMRTVHERPTRDRIAHLESELAQLRAEDAAAEEEGAAANANAWDVVGKAVENAPEIIRTVADEIRRGGERATEAEGGAGDD